MYPRNKESGNKDYEKGQIGHILIEWKEKEGIPTDELLSLFKENNKDKLNVTSESLKKLNDLKDMIQSGLSPDTVFEIIQKYLEEGEIITSYTIKEGRISVFGSKNKGIIKEEKIDTTPEQLKIIKNIEKIGILHEIIQIWMPHAQKEVDSLFFKSVREGTTVIPKSIKTIKNLFGGLTEKNIQQKDIENDINKIWEEIEKSEKATNIIGASDMKDVKNIFYGKESKDQKLLKIYNLMRYGGLSGNTEGVKEQVSLHLLEKNEFKNVSDILHDSKTFEFIKGGNRFELKQIISKKFYGEKYNEFHHGEECSKIAVNLIKAYKEMSTKYQNQRSDFQKILFDVNKQREENNEEKISLDDFIALALEQSIISLTKHTLLRVAIEKLPNRGNEKESYIGLYANISGLAEKSINDWIVIADENIDIAIDIGSTLAIAMVTMGTGALVLSSAIALSRATRLAQLASKPGKLGMVARGAGIAGQGIAFYEGMNFMDNIIYGNDLFKGAGDKKEIIKSIAFIGVLRGVSGLSKKIEVVKGVTNPNLMQKGLQFTGKMTDKVPGDFLKYFGAILIEGGLITGISGGIDYAFDENHDWTLEEYLHAVVLAGLIRGATKVKFSKGKNGEVKADIIQESQPSKSTNIKTEPTHSTSQIKTENQIKEINRLRKIGNTRKNELNSKIKELEKEIKTLEAKTPKTNDDNIVLRSKKQTLIRNKRYLEDAKKELTSLGNELKGLQPKKPQESQKSKETQESQKSKETTIENNSLLRSVQEKVQSKLGHLPKITQENLAKSIIELLKAGIAGGAFNAGVFGGINHFTGGDFTDNIIDNFLIGFAAGVGIRLILTTHGGIKQVYTISKNGLLGTSSSTSILPKNWKSIAIGTPIASGAYKLYSILGDD